MATRAAATAGRTNDRGSTPRALRTVGLGAASVAVGAVPAAPSSVFTPDSMFYTPCRPTVITRRRLSTSNAITASTNGVMSR